MNLLILMQDYYLTDSNVAETLRSNGTAHKSVRKKKSTTFTHRSGFVYYYIAINHIFSCLLKL